MKWLLYNLLFTLVYILMMPHFLLRMRKRGGYRNGFLERFGFYRQDTLAPLQGHRPIWIHAVSVGEVAVASRCMHALRAARPDVRFVLSVTTSTGRVMAQSHIHASDALIYFPVDFPFVIHRVCRQLNPCLLLLTECEIWPNLIRRLDDTGIPVAIINGRLSSRSLAGYRKIRFFFADILKRMRVFLVQTQTDRERLIALGADATRIFVTGSMKYSLPPADRNAIQHARNLLRQAGIADDARLVVGGSTWPGEELALADACRSIRPRIPNLRLILVPRHAERRDEICTTLRNAGHQFVLRSLLDNHAPSITDPETLIIDSTGELAGFYPLAEVVFIGKSLGSNHGGQNVIEPAAFGKPVMTGPNMENFPGIMNDFRADQAVIEVLDCEHLNATLQKLLDDPFGAAEIGNRAGKLVARNSGALDRSMPHILALLD